MRAAQWAVVLLSVAIAFLTHFHFAACDVPREWIPVPERGDSLLLKNISIADHTEEIETMAAVCQTGDIGAETLLIDLDMRIPNHTGAHCWNIYGFTFIQNKLLVADDHCALNESNFDFSDGGLAAVMKFDRENVINSHSIHGWRTMHSNGGILEEKISTKLSFRSLFGYVDSFKRCIGRPLGLTEGSNEISRTNGGYKGRNQGDSDANHGVEGSIGCGVSGLALGGQVVLIVLIGFGFALLFGRCIFVALEETPKARRWIWYSAAGFSAAAALFFYSFALWGLR